MEHKGERLVVESLTEETGAAGAGDKGGADVGALIGSENIPGWMR